MAASFNAYKVLISLAGSFGHGWAKYAHDKEAPLTDRGWAEFEDKICQEMAEKENNNPAWMNNHPCGSEGLRPSLSHSTQTGRVSWELWDGHTTNPKVKISINRPKGTVLTLYFDKDTPEGRITKLWASEIELRHIQAAWWCLEAVYSRPGGYIGTTEIMKIISKLPGYPTGVASWELRDRLQAEAEIDLARSFGSCRS